MIEQPTDIAVRLGNGRDAGERLSGLSRAEIERHLSRLSALAAIEMIGPSLQHVLDTIVQSVASLLPADCGASVILWDPIRQAFYAAATSTAGQRSATLEMRRSEGGATRWIIDEGEPVICADTAADPFPANPQTGWAGIRSYAGIPIVSEGAALGVLYALRSEPGEWSEQDLMFLDTLARRAAVAIVNARLQAQTQEARDRAEALSYVANALVGVSDVSEVLQIIVDGAAAAVAADQTVLVLLDENKELINQYRIGGPAASSIQRESYDELMSGLTGWAVEHAETAISSKDEPDERESEDLRRRRLATGGGSIVVSPLQFQDRVLGTLTAIRPVTSEDFTPNDAALVDSIARMAAVAVENARLASQTRSTLHELSSMYRVVQTLNSDEGLEELLDSLADAVAESLPADRVVFFLTDDDKRSIEMVATGGPGAVGLDVSMDFDELWQGLSGYVLRTRRPVRSPSGEPDGRESPAVRERRRASGTGAVLVVPLFHRGKQLGTLTAMNRPDQGDFTQREVDAASVMAGQISVAVANTRLFEEMQRLATTDELTKVHNRRNLFELGSRECGAASRYGRALSAIMFDIDNFKQVNDTYGHGVGDEVLVEVVERCRPLARQVDVFGRYGGEEFVIVLPETDAKGAIEMAERLRAAVADSPVQTSAGPVPLTISAGVAGFTPEMKDVHELIDRADAAMFFAKRLGRNRVEAR